MMLSIATVIQNEARWLPEWLEYHLLPHVGITEFLLYDDGSTDALADALRPYSAVVRQFSTDALHPWPRTSLIHTHVCAMSRAIKGWAGGAPFEHWCERVAEFPQQLAMIRHASGAARTEFVAFVDVDEYLICLSELPLVRWLAGLERDVGGVVVSGRVMMSTRTAPPILNETEELEFEPSLWLDKCIVRRRAVHPSTVGIVHEVALADGWRYVRDATLSLVHYRYRAFEERYARHYVVEGGNTPEVGRLSKLRLLQHWRKQHQAARARRLYTHYVSVLAYVHRTQRALWRRAHPQRPYGQRRVVVVAEMRSGSTWFAQRVFGARDDVLYLYEPCRAEPVVRGPRVGRWFDAQCVHIVRQLLDCATPLATWRLMKQDWTAVELSTPGAFQSYRNFSAMCRSRHVVVKVVRVHDPAPLATDECTVIHVERNASRVETSRRRNGLFSLNVHAGQRAKRAGANLTVRLEEARADPEGTATRLHALTGMEPVAGLECSQPIARPFAACGLAPPQTTP
jgi:hypothetical protein